jgi:hypothetical protein
VPELGAVLLLAMPYPTLHALHDALLKPMPGVAASPSLAELWTSRPTT